SVAVQVRFFRPKPGVLASVMVTCAALPKEKTLNCFWLAGSVPAGGVTPSFTSVKLGSTSGTLFVDGPVEVKLNGVEPVRLVPSPARTFLVTVKIAGKTTAELDNPRSWLPPTPSSPSTRMWNGEPVMATAELVMPQSFRLAMWPPQASTGAADAAVKLIVMLVELSPL